MQVYLLKSIKTIYYKECLTLKVANIGLFFSW